ncbi:hypothetical protein H5410_020029 [Solanum commersonii]|uniref:Uncharacterized protein n=1 Tax=Solanum commersonii TaxID=4109 RepID=A0A9J5ZBA1_SOLCO|nr:hypothetical protein H5410_020029 [Solanum commersonii]
MLFLFSSFAHILEVGNQQDLVMIYDSVENAKKYEPEYRLIRNGLDTKVEKSRQQMKERKNKLKSTCGKIKEYLRVAIS